MHRFLPHISEKQPDPWDSTISGKIYHNLQRKLEAVDLFAEVQISNRGAPTEVFHYQKQHARLVKHLVGGASTGEGEAEMRIYVEAWEYFHLAWWRQTLDELCLMHPDGPVELLPVPVVLAASDAGIAECEELFLPNGVIQKYGFSDTWQVKIAIDDYVRRQVRTVLQPHCTVEFESDFNRIVPMDQHETPLTMLDPLNAVQGFIREKIQSVVPVLKDHYEHMNGHFPTDA